MNNNHGSHNKDTHAKDISSQSRNPRTPRNMSTSNSEKGTHDREMAGFSYDCTSSVVWFQGRLRWLRLWGVILNVVKHFIIRYRSCCLWFITSPKGGPLFAFEEAVRPQNHYTFTDTFHAVFCTYHRDNIFSLVSCLPDWWLMNGIIHPSGHGSNQNYWYIPCHSYIWFPK